MKPTPQESFSSAEIVKAFGRRTPVVREAGVREGSVLEAGVRWPAAQCAVQAVSRAELRSPANPDPTVSRSNDGPLISVQYPSPAGIVTSRNVICVLARPSARRGRPDRTPILRHRPWAASRSRMPRDRRSIPGRRFGPAMPERPRRTTFRRNSAHADRRTAASGLSQRTRFYTVTVPSRSLNAPTALLSEPSHCQILRCHAMRPARR